MNQWYSSNKGLFDEEVKIIQSNYPNAKMGFTSDERLFFNIELNLEQRYIPRIWSICAIFNSDYPKIKYGGSIYGGAIKVYSLRPNYQEMISIMNLSPFYPKPERLCFMISDANRVSDYRTGNEHYIFSLGNRSWLTPRQYLTADTYIRDTIKYICLFELAMKEKEIWDKFIVDFH